MMTTYKNLAKSVEKWLWHGHSKLCNNFPIYGSKSLNGNTSACMNSRPKKFPLLNALLSAKNVQNKILNSFLLSWWLHLLICNLITVSLLCPFIIYASNAIYRVDNRSNESFQRSLNKISREPWNCPLLEVRVSKGSLILLNFFKSQNILRIVQ